MQDDEFERIPGRTGELSFSFHEWRRHWCRSRGLSVRSVIVRVTLGEYQRTEPALAREEARSTVIIYGMISKEVPSDIR
jgi:hypothetical protein